jgi:hypothetical protein
VIAGRVGSHGAAALGGLLIGLATNMVWESYGSPDVSVRAAAGIVQVEQRYADGRTTSVSSLRDLSSDRVLVSSTVTERGTPLVRAANQAIVLKLVVQNQGRRAASRIRVPVFVTTMGTPSVSGTPDVQVSIDSSGTRRDHRNDVVVIESLQPRTSAVITYEVDIDTAVGAKRWDHGGFEARVPSAVSDETGPIRVPRRLVPLGLAIDFEGKLSRSGAVFSVRAWSESPSPRESSRAEIEVHDPWIRNSDSTAASVGLRSADDYATYIRRSFR